MSTPSHSPPPLEARNVKLPKWEERQGRQAVSYLRGGVWEPRNQQGLLRLRLKILQAGEFSVLSKLRLP